MEGAKVSLISTDIEHSTSEGKFDRWVGGFTEHGDIDV
jgi:tyrosinase